MQNNAIYGAVAQTEITNPEAEVLDPLYAKILILRRDDVAAVIIGMDTTAIGGCAISDGILPDGGENLRPALQKVLHERFQISPESLLLNASHTHPAGRLLCNEATQIQRIAEAIGEALARLEPVKIGVGAGVVDDLTMNRVIQLKDGSDWTLRHTNPSPWDDEVKTIRPVDPGLCVIRVDKTDGTALALLYNFGCHPLFGDVSGRITANFVKAASQVIEETLGGNAMAIFLQGAGGDVMDRTFKTFTRPREVDTMGTMLGIAVLRAWRKIKPQADIEFAVRTEVFALPRKSEAEYDRQITLLQAEQSRLLTSLCGCTLNFKNFLTLFLQYRLNPEYPLGDVWDYLQDQSVGNTKRMEMDKLNRKLIEQYIGHIRTMEKLAKLQDDLATLLKHRKLRRESGEDTISHLLQVIRLGDSVLVATGLEPLTAVAVKLRQSSPFAHTIIAGFSNQYLHYGTPDDMYHGQGYEVRENCLELGWEAIFLAKTKALLHEIRNTPLSSS